MAGRETAQVVVPSFIGLPVHEARSLADDNRLLLTSEEPDGPPLGHLTWAGHWVVMGQRPPAGEVVVAWSWVVIDFMDLGGGESGDREPRVPEPPFGRLAWEQAAPGRRGS